MSVWGAVVFLVGSWMSSVGMGVVLDWPLTGDFGLCFMLDGWSLLFCGVVWVISGCVFVFSGRYMGSDRCFRRFSLGVVAFVLAMNVMVLAGNLFTGLVGWDGLGVSSLYLVQYYSNHEAYEASMITALSNRVGDALLVLGLGSGLVLSSDYSLLLGLSGWVVLASMTKSAQFPFSAWLPAAMMAPTPVSSLVHSSTLVTAGVYLLVRCEEIATWLEGEWGDWLCFFSLLTMCVAGSSAVFEDDLKKVVALSTLGHLSFMMVALALNLPDLAMCHCLVHALGKAGMFLCVGEIISVQQGSQDRRWVGIEEVLEVRPVAGWGLFLSSMSLSGVVFLSASVSKEAIVGSCLEGGLSLVCVVMLLLGVFLSFLYTWGIWFGVCSAKLKSSPWQEEGSGGGESEWAIVFLTSSCIWSGWVFKELYFFGGKLEWSDNAWINWFFVGGGFLTCLYDSMYWAPSGDEGSIRNWKRFPFQSMLFLESISGQVPSFLMWKFSNWVKYYGEGWVGGTANFAVWCLKPYYYNTWNVVAKAPALASSRPGFFWALFIGYILIV